MPDSKNQLDLSGPMPKGQSIEEVLKRSDLNAQAPSSGYRSIEDILARAELNVPVVTPVIQDPTGGSAPVYGPSSDAVPGEAPIPGPQGYNFPELDPAGVRFKKQDDGTVVSPPGTPGSMPPMGPDRAQLGSALAGGSRPVDASAVDFSGPEKRAYVTTTQAMETVRPKSSTEANVLSRATKDRFIADRDGN